MTASLFGWNINAAESSEGHVLDIVRRTKARSHTVMHGLGLARKIHDLVGQTTGEEPVVVCREDWPDQDWNKFRDVRGYVAGWKGRGGYWPDAYCYFLNEPVVGGDVNRVNDLLRVCIDFMHEAARQGVKAVVGNFPDASLFEHGWLDTGVFDEFLRVASQWTNTGHGYIGHHNYSYGTSWTGSAATPYGQLKTRNPSPPSKDAFQRAAPHGHARENWLQGRFMFPLLRCDALGIPRYRFVCTEGVWDRMPNGEIEGWIPQAEAFWGLGKLRGPLDQRQLWTKLFPDVSPARAGVDQLRALAALMDGLPCAGVHLFTLSNNAEWTTFNFLNWPEFVDELAAYSASLSGGPPIVSNPTVIPKPSDAGAPVQARITSAYNLRSGPGTTYAAVTVLEANSTVTYYPNETAKTQANGFEWVYVEQNGKAGFVAHQGQFVPLVPADWPSDKSILLDVPFVSQRNTGLNNCLEAAFTMLLNYWLAETGARGFVTVQDVIAFVNNNGAYGNLTDAARLIAHFQLPAVVKTNLSLAALRDELDAGRPFVALVNRGKLPGANAIYAFSGSHFVTVVGYDATRVIFHDPLGTEDGPGDRFSVSPADFDAAWATTPGNSGLYQAILLKPEALTQPPPPVDEPECPPLQPDVYAALLQQTAALEHAHNDLVTAQQVYAAAHAEALEAIRAIIGYQ